MNVAHVEYHQAGAARYVLAHCRSRDRQEVDAVLGLEWALANLDAWLSASVMLEVFWAHGMPAAFVAVHQVTPNCVAMSMIATNYWPHVARSIAKWAKRQCMPTLIEAGYRRAECRAIAGHEDAAAFLDWLGFKLEGRCPEYGAGGEDFELYGWVSKDHV